MSRIAVTGANGFIGAAVVHRCRHAGHEVRALVGPPAAAPAALPPEVEPFAGDIDSPALLGRLLGGCDAVIHLAGPASVAASFEAPAQFARAHVVGTATLLEAARRARVARVVYVSSAEVYGVPRQSPVSEEHPLQARSPYGAAKIGAEALIESFRVAYGGAYVVVRPFSVYGPRQSPGGVVGRIVRQVLHDDVVALAAPEVVRDFCFVDDVAEALVGAASAQASGTFNVASGRGVSIAALARAAGDALGRSVHVRQADSDRPARADIATLVGDAARIHAALDWQPRTALVDGLRRTIDWFRTLEAS